MSLFVVDTLFAINQLTLLAAVGFAGGLYLFVRGFRLLARKRLLLNTPTSKIRSASLGLVEVSGCATGPYTVPAPITGVHSFLYRIIAWQKRNESKTGEWTKVAEESLHIPFFLDDTTGQLLIEPSGAELDLRPNFRDNFNDTIFSPHATPQVLSFLARHGIEPSSNIRIEECTIQPQDPLFIVGTLTQNPGVEVRPFADLVDQNPVHRIALRPPTPQPSQEVVRLSNTASCSTVEDMTQQSKIAAALSKAGITSPTAWEAAGVPSWRPAMEQNATHVREVSVTTQHAMSAKPENVCSFDLSPPVLLMKGANTPAFLISWRSQRELVRSLAWKSAAMIWGGGALTLLGIYVLLQQLELL